MREVRNIGEKKRTSEKIVVILTEKEKSEDDKNRSIFIQVFVFLYIAVLRYLSTDTIQIMSVFFRIGDK